MASDRTAFKGVIFDLDGTLVNSLQDIADSMNSALNAKGFKTHDYDSYRYFVGRGLRNLVSQVLSDKDKTAENINILYVDLLKEYGKNLVKNTALYQGIPILLDELKARNLKLAVLSNKNDAFTKEIAEKLLSRWSFNVILGSSNDIPRKPDPTGALMISESFHIAPEEVLYLGDTGIDMQTALAAKMFSVGVTWGFRDREELINNGAKTVIDRPEELLHLL